MVLTVDSAIPADALDDIAVDIGATSARSVDLSDVVNVTARDGTSLAVHDLGSGPGLLCVLAAPAARQVSLRTSACSTRHTRCTCSTAGGAVTRSCLLTVERGVSVARSMTSRTFARRRTRPWMVPPATPLVAWFSLPHAARHPDAVRRLVLVTPSGLPSVGPWDDLDSIRGLRRRRAVGRRGCGGSGDRADRQSGAAPASTRRRRPLWYGRGG